MIGLVATLAPTIGPTVGGYLTDALLLALAVPGQRRAGHRRHGCGADPDRLRQAQLRRCSATSTGSGLRSMAVFLGALEYVLEEGPRNDWFGDDTVLLMAWVVGARRRSPSSRACSRPSSRSSTCAPSPTAISRLGCLFSFVLGIGLYGLTYLYPVYLARVRGYDALQIGETMFVTGRLHVPDGADRRPPVAQGRPAADDGRRLPVLRRRHLAG